MIPSPTASKSSPRWLVPRLTGSGLIGMQLSSAGVKHPAAFAL